ncbi:MAG: hypothetical protein R3E96_06105 [Planctomycetota bacterium]
MSFSKRGARFVPVLLHDWTDIRKELSEEKQRGCTALQRDRFALGFHRLFSPVLFAQLGKPTP